LATLHISLLGGFEARLRSGEVLALKGRKTQALVAYLALAPGEQRTRDELVALLWGDRGEQQARSSLRQSLSELRKALGDAGDSLLVAERDAVSLDADAIDVDVTEFERLIDDGTPAALERAAELYRGDLLDGIGVHNPAFEDWLRDARRRLSERACEALSKLLDHQAAEDSERAIATARRLLALDPLQEAVHRTLMRLHAGRGERTLALKQYQVCRDVLDAELGIAPEAETEVLAEEIRTGAVGTDRAVEAAPEPLMPSAEPLPDKPSVVVLPFTNMSGDPEQEYFSDGITEDIITELSRFHGLSVIARNSAFHYKDKSPKIQDMARELGVGYVVEGSVRKAGNRVRITAQLVDAATGNHIWAERYDRDLEDIFAVQDEVTRIVVSTVAGRIDSVGYQRATRMSPDSLKAYDLFLRAKSIFLRFTRADNAEARDLLKRVIALDPANAQAHAVLCETYFMDWVGNWVEDGDYALNEAIRWGKKAVAVDDADSRSHWTLGEAYLLTREFDKARFHIEKAIDLNPNDVEALTIYGFFLTCVREFPEAIAVFERARQVDPQDLNYVPWLEGFAYFTARQYDEAIACFEKIEDPHYEVYSLLSASYAYVGRLDDAKPMLEEFLRRAEHEMVDFPGRSLAAWKRNWHSLACYEDEADGEHWLHGLRKAGLEG
jgi:TolB-like protein